MAGRVVVITGAGAGIGRATALRFARAGDRIAAWDADDRGADELVAELAEAGGEGSFRRLDVRDAPALEDAAAEVVERWGRLDVLINNAGIVRDHQLVRWKDGEVTGALSEEDFDAVVAVNLKGVYLATRAVVPYMIRGGGGAIVSASSVVGLYGNFGQTSYVAAKAGIVGMTRTWARELGRFGIRVNAVAPGFIDTEMARGVPEKVLETIVGRTPLRRLGRPEEVAEAYHWLASDAAGFVHGAVLSVDGGLVVGT